MQLTSSAARDWRASEDARCACPVMSLEIRHVELELEPPYSWVDLDLPDPGDSWQVTGCRAGGARDQAVFARSEGKLDVVRGPKER